MNEKIRKLAEKSGFFPVPDSTEWDWEYLAENARYEHFAYLVAEECAKVCIDHNIWYEDAAGEAYSLAIKQHFGIE